MVDLERTIPLKQTEMIPVFCPTTKWRWTESDDCLFELFITSTFTFNNSDDMTFDTLITKTTNKTQAVHPLC